MQFRLTTLFAAVVLMSAPVAYAQSGNFVPPPSPPGGVAAKTPAAPTVLPPTMAPSANPAAVAQPETTPRLIDIAIPAAPRPGPPPVAASSLKPSAPSAPAATPVARKSAPKAESSIAPTVKVVIDPFSGIVGTPVSDSQLNRFVFPEAIGGIYFQEGAPLPECPPDASAQDPCKPIFLNGRKMMLLQLRAGAKGPIQMLTHLESGRVVTLNLMPTAGPGAVVRVEGAEDGASDTRLAAARSPSGVGPGNSGGMTASEQNVETLARFARGDIPAGFEPVGVSADPVRFSHFDVIQKSSWDNGAGLKAHLFQIRANTEQPVAISPDLFRHDAVQALALDRETITASEPAYLYMLEAVTQETN